MFFDNFYVTLSLDTTEILLYNFDIIKQIVKNTAKENNMKELQGTVFDIKEFAVHDGPGMRVTVFMKGCPLRCIWCHNPEGLSSEPQLVKNEEKCVHCKCCEKAFPCSHPECQPYGVCTKVCPLNILKISGTKYTPEALVERLMRYKVFFRNGGGITFSGGEPTMQGNFVLECMKLLHKAEMRTGIETSAFCNPKLFAEIIAETDDIYIDLKEIDNEKHKLLTGVPNEVILENIKAVGETGREFTIRMPIIPGINDSHTELTKAAEFLLPYKDRVKVELLPYNTLTGAKYKLVGMEYKPEFDEKAKPNTDVEVFRALGFDCVTYKH